MEMMATKMNMFNTTYLLQPAFRTFERIGRSSEEGRSISMRLYELRTHSLSLIQPRSGRRDGPKPQDLVQLYKLVHT